MPAVKPGSLVLVTGASGYIAAHTVDILLQRGFNVRGTVRSQSKGEYLSNLFKNAPAKFEYHIVGDIAQDGAFDDAVKGVDAVAHMASPFHLDAVEPAELFEPAEKGTLGVLKSLRKFNPDCKRVVITSSVATIVNSDLPQPHTFTEAYWNPVSLKVCAEKGRDADGVNKYRGSKILAEKAFWKFIEDEKPSFDGVAINPPLVLGPIIHECATPESLNTSVASFYDWMIGKKTQDDLPAAGGNYVDVRDCAIGHVQALVVEEAAGERFITGNGASSGNDYVLSIAKAYPDIKGVPKGNPDPAYRQKLRDDYSYFDGSKATKVLGIQYRPQDETFGDMAKSLRERFGSS
ncbi:dihydrokaempferol 4-reductase [Cryptococcus wingfieldii CBS 7118]|uniref:Dihydrokaempferol 4-reductase n=1 Tax=Cryptococcus wingfieldii CBS 7118 TaxID=1295528 RepID=A0A1E3IXV5_9TREE|nr:dihydrokaempferol 4-reductase [Cryptococcus wingfieldii CBS 7118]ODN92736.1 dihydrokaempferol 4-reductase [Cryptococcus wingfieldii CBS 7118]